jgi:hypothetical protein
VRLYGLALYMVNEIIEWYPTPEEAERPSRLRISQGSRRWDGSSLTDGRQLRRLNSALIFFAGS